jgi:hypothetical protein
VANRASLDLGANIIAAYTGITATVATSKTSSGGRTNGRTKCESGRLKSGQLPAATRRRARRGTHRSRRTWCQQRGEGGDHREGGRTAGSTTSGHPPRCIGGVDAHGGGLQGAHSRPKEGNSQFFLNPAWSSTVLPCRK